MAFEECLDLAYLGFPVTSVWKSSYGNWKKLQPGQTWLQNTEPSVAVVYSFEPVAVVVPFNNYLKTACNRFELVATNYSLAIEYNVFILL